jgi:hypothetical protein
MFEATVQARDSRPDRTRTADTAPARQGGSGGPIGSGIPPRPAFPPRPGIRPGAPNSGRVVTKTAPRPPIFTHAEPGGFNPQRYPSLPVVRSGFGLPNLRRNVCPHFYVSGSRGAIPIQAPHLLKALIRQEQNVSRCQLRGGVHLEQGYVNDVCLTPRFNQCVFYEDDLTKA